MCVTNQEAELFIHLSFIFSAKETNAIMVSKMKHEPDCPFRLNLWQ
jgi:hypothetical protein